MKRFCLWGLELIQNYQISFFLKFLDQAKHMQRQRVGPINLGQNAMKQNTRFIFIFLNPFPKFLIFLSRPLTWVFFIIFFDDANLSFMILQTFLGNFFKIHY